MSDQLRADVTRLLGEVEHGNRAALDELLPLLYAELHRMAHFERKDWHGDLTLNTTALVHEAYLKLVDQSQAHWENRAHFLAIAARAMRQILINYAVARRRQKRGGVAAKVSLEEMFMGGREPVVLDDAHTDVLLELHEALERLEMASTRAGRVVECRFFGGMSVEETALALGISVATVKRDWIIAQAWLRLQLTAA